MNQLLSDKTERKFIEEFDVSDYEILTEDGYKDITSSKKTIEYDVWKLVTENGHFLECADTHIVIDSFGNEVYAKDSLGVMIQTIEGNSIVSSVVKPDYLKEHMYDLSIDSDNHTFYSNGILSHNSISSVAYLLWYAIFNPEKVIAILANKGATAREMLSRVTLMLENLPFFLQPGCKTLNKGSIEFSNNSKIVAAATSGSSIRGLSVSLLFLDEFAFIENDATFYTSTYPVVSSGTSTRIIITSTANGIGNVFYKLWEGANQKTNDFKPFRVDWQDVPGRDEEWKRQTIANTSELQFTQEFGNSFIGGSDTLVTPECLLTLNAIDPIKETYNLRVYKDPEHGHEYMMFVDIAKGRGQDYSTFNIIDITSSPFEQVCVFQDNNISPLLYPDVLYKYAMLYNEAYIIVESNDQGSIVCNGLYYELEYENVYVESIIKSNSIGVTMTKKIKRIGTSNMKDIIEQNKLKINDANTIIELSTFISRGSSFEASRGNHDDLVMNLVLFAWFTSTPFFGEMTDINIKNLLYSEKVRAMEDDIVPVGIFDDGREDAFTVEDGVQWETINTGMF
jgi:hypothetical protein